MDHPPIRKDLPASIQYMCGQHTVYVWPAYSICVASVQYMCGQHTVHVWPVYSTCILESVAADQWTMSFVRFFAFGFDWLIYTHKCRYRNDASEHNLFDLSEQNVTFLSELCRLRTRGSVSRLCTQAALVHAANKVIYYMLIHVPLHGYSVSTACIYVTYLWLFKLWDVELTESLTVW